MSKTRNRGGGTRAERESMAGLLAHRLAESGQTAAISVAELYRVHIPYHECRDRLGLASKGEYDVALLNLLCDPDLIRIDDDLVRAVERELASPEPGLAVLKNFAAARLEVRAGPVEPVSEESASVESEADTVEAEDASAAADAVPAGDAKEANGMDSAPGSCWQCDGALPRGPDIRFCPHCGSDQSTPRCPSCEFELDREWKYCPRCGAGSEG